MMVCSLQPPSSPISSSKDDWQPSLVHRPSIERATAWTVWLVCLSCSSACRVLSSTSVTRSCSSLISR
eukprot:CAMPEP_0119081634 /NCGR_PEP_ID=MMETSP1178-20130426/117712_1 /TAXON_ID=33656 /ORGANISM="unid sp, Strain CCMP2000" /LENGTH=67 /DNA_ID=CAMNT_0007064351 /DNA_START=31 /DNA_END=230 /DNA_ORIENTATION=-